MIAWLKFAALAAAVSFLIGLGWTLRGWKAGADQVAALNAAERQRIANADRAEWASRDFETDRDARREAVRAPDARRDTALAALDCPVPADALRGVLRAAGQPVADSDASKP